MSFVLKRALVLAAGLGTRLRPLTFGVPKPLLPIWNVSLLERSLCLLEAWGIEEIAVNLHWLPAKIKEYIETRQGRAKVFFSYEKEILGTGGALRPLKSFFQDDPFWIVNADIVAHLNPEPLCEAFFAGDGFAIAWVEPKKGPRTIEVDRQQRITCYRSPTPGVPGTYTFCGVQIVSPRIFDFFPERACCTLVEIYEQAMQSGVFVKGISVPHSYWNDAGTPAAYLQVHKELIKMEGATDRSQSTKHFFCVGKESHVAADVQGVDSVVYGNATVLSGSVLKQCVIAGGSVSGTLENVVCVAASEVSHEVLPAAIDALGWKSDDVGAALMCIRGSGRVFWRLYCGAQSVIYNRYSIDRFENARYSGHAYVLAEAGVPVPKVLVDIPKQCCLVIEDWGDSSLQKRMQVKPQSALAWYCPVIKALAHFHDVGTRHVQTSRITLESPFDKDLYDWEHQLFENFCLKQRFGLQGLPAAVQHELQQVSDRLLKSPQVLVHRDCQSSNVIFRLKQFVFIDFQGMRMGAAAYDLASLLYDPYVKLSSVFRKKLLAEYQRYCLIDNGAVALFYEGAVQRLIQALGAYGRLVSVGQPEFTRYVLPALEHLLDVADILELEALGGLAEELIAREQNRYGM